MNKTAHPDEDGMPVTPPLPDRIEAALSKLKGWAMWPDGYPHHRSAELDAAIAEVVAERDVRGQELGDARKALWDAVAERDAATKRADGLAASLRLLDRIVVGGEHHNGTEPEDIQQIVERFVILRADLSEAKADVRDLTDVLRRNGNAQRDELLRNISAAVQTLREVNERSAKPDEKRGLCSSAFCNGNHHDSACEGDYLTSRWIESMSAAIARAQSGQPSRDWPEDAAHENGQYQCICAKCGASFVGHKRRVECKACDKGPVGINGQRDPDHPCDMFRYGKPSERNTCEGDGHYLCNECGHYRCDPPEQSGQPAQRDDNLSKHDDHCNCERCR